jgi:DNA-binding response OmpR family regulator
MSDLNLNDVNLVLVDHRVQLRNTLRMALNEAGIHYNNIVDGNEVGAVEQSVQGSLGPDIIICDADSRGGDLFELTRAIRNNRIGLNPFLAIVALSWDPTERVVRDAVNSGADFLIAAPFSPKQILDRIRSLVYNRAPFVITGEYVGPDRRDGGRRDPKTPLIHVPNSLRDKTMGEYDARAFREQVRSAVVDMSSQKMEIHAYRVAADAATAANDFARDPFSIDSNCLDRLQSSAADLKWRAQKGSMVSIAELSEALLNVLRSVRRDPPNRLYKDIELMKQLSMAIRAAIHPAQPTEAIAYDIAAAVSTRG